MQRFLSIASVLFLAAFAGGVEAKLFRCQDERGRWSFQDRPCPTGTERESVRERHLAPKEQPDGRRERVIPTACRVESEPLRFEDEALTGVEAKLIMTRDEKTYQLLLSASGEWLDPDFAPRPLALAPQLIGQGLLIGDGELMIADWLTDLRTLGYGHSRTKALLEAGKTAFDLRVVLRVQGRSTTDYSLPTPASLLEDLRNRALACKQEDAA